MTFHRTTSFFLLGCALALLAAATGCNFSSDDQRARDEKTRDEVAKATERAKPALEEAGRTIDRAVDDAAHQARAAAQGVRDGLKNGPRSLIDVNSASEDQLLELPGVGKLQARKIIANRPYAGKRDLVTKGAISDATYAKISDQITAR